MKSKSKNDIFYVVLLVLTLITMIIGITFTYYSLMLSKEKDSTIIKTGTLAINYVDGKEIGDFLFIPINEPRLNSSYSVYKKKFSVVSNGTLDQMLDINLNVTSNSFANNALKYSIYSEDGTKLGIGSIPSDGKVKIAGDVYLKSGDTGNYTVLIWLQESNTNQNYEQGNSFSGGFDITANQVKYE